MAARMAMMAITTNNSIKVKPNENETEREAEANEELLYWPNRFAGWRRSANAPGPLAFRPAPTRQIEEYPPPCSILRHDVDPPDRTLNKDFIP